LHQDVAELHIPMRVRWFERCRILPHRDRFAVTSGYAENAAERGIRVGDFRVEPDCLSVRDLRAIEIAGDTPVEVEQMEARAFLERELARPRPDVATVVYHSVFMQYVDEPGRRRINEVIEAAPVFHLAMEPGDDTFEIRLDGELLGTCRAHGTGVRWL